MNRMTGCSASEAEVNEGVVSAAEKDQEGQKPDESDSQYLQGGIETGGSEASVQQRPERQAENHGQGQHGRGTQQCGMIRQESRKAPAAACEEIPERFSQPGTVLHPEEHPAQDHCQQCQQANKNPERMTLSGRRRTGSAR